MTDELAGKVLDAYKTSPLLTGLLLVIIGLLIGYGWMEFRRAERTNEYVTNQLARESELQKQLLEMAKLCGGKP